MTIERYSFPNGIPIQEDIGINEQLDELVNKRRDARQNLHVGQFDLTPDVWTRYDSHRMFHHLTVLEDGTGVYRVLPKDSGVGTQEVVGGEKLEAKLGGKILHLNSASIPIVVAGPRRDDPQYRIYEYVGYTPGVSPMPTREQQLRMDETISEPIFSVDEADERIVQKAKNEVLALPWSEVGPLQLPIDEMFQPLAYLTLRQARHNFALNLLDRDDPSERKMIAELPTTHKKRAVGQYWKVLRASSLSPRDATFMKDYLYISTPEAIAQANDLDVAETIFMFSRKSESYVRAGFRVASYLAKK